MKATIILKLIKELYTETIREILVEKAASTDTRIDDFALGVIDALLGIGNE